MDTGSVSVAQFEQQEREAAKLLQLGSLRWVLLACVALFWVAVFLPFAGGVPGWSVLAVSTDATRVQTKLTEFVFLWLALIGVGVLTLLVVVTRRFAFAAPAWMVTTVAFFVSLLAIWLRRSSSTYDAGFYHGPGAYLAIVAVGIAVFTYIPALTRRGARLEEATRRRIDADRFDAVGQAQLDATRRIHHDESAALFVDDRRARAAQRHQRAE